MKGVTSHGKCNGTGIISYDEDGIAEICVECMGSGIEELDFEMGDHPNWVK
jgi:hypothetical protein